MCARLRLHTWLNEVVTGLGSGGPVVHRDENPSSRLRHCVFTFAHAGERVTDLAQDVVCSLLEERLLSRLLSAALAGDRAHIQAHDKAHQKQQEQDRPQRQDSPRARPRTARRTKPAPYRHSPPPLPTTWSLTVHQEPLPKPCERIGW